LRFSRAFFFRCRSFRQRRSALDPRPIDADSTDGRADRPVTTPRSTRLNVVRSPTLSFVAAVAAAGLLIAGGTASAGASGAAAKPTLTIRSSAYGRMLFDGNGRALYAFTRDPRGGKSRCYGACATAWPIYYARGKLRATAGVKRSLLGTTRRSDGRLQVTYNGWPLYYYVNDRKPGQVTCQNVKEFGGLWLVVRPNGKLVR
jgi:predicted lipoprotein with Yx(FWY)xxD motif